MQGVRGLVGGRLAKLAAYGLLGVAGCLGSAAQATEGYFQYGYGARQGALGGAGVADSRDAMSLTLNPAGLVDVGRELQVGASLFVPLRGYDVTGPGFVAPGLTSGSVDSNNNYFVVPNVAYSSPIDAQSAWGVAMYGNGGMNTTYPGVANSSCPPGFFGVYCGGNAGVDLSQMFISAGYSRSVGAFSFGIAPTIAIQWFKANGLGLFGLFGLSSDPANLSDRGYSYSYGGGLRAGIEFKATDRIRLGLSAQTPMWMTKFSKYSGLFAGQGSFDIPAAVTAGIAVDVMPNLTLMFDWRHIFYSSVAAVGDASGPILPGSLGTNGGPGFGWRDVDAFKVGAEWRANPAWTFRLGYAHNNNPIGSSDVTINILAPGVVTDHITGGFEYKMTPNSSIEFAAAVIPSHSVSGIEVTPLGPNPFRTVTLSMNQYQFTLGYTYHFGQPAPLVRKY